MKSERGTILYIGKAKDLRKRVSSYWTKQAQDRIQIEPLLKRTKDVDFIVTDTEKEALILENTLIKKHKPKYNIELRDDKSFPSIKLSIQDEYPRIYYTRDLKKDGSLFFGPYASAFACRQVVDYVEKYFQLRTCSDHELVSRKRPCIQYQIDRCSAPCVGKIDKAAYQMIVAEVCLLLEGKGERLRATMVEKMEQASESLAFEQAAHYRDLLGDLDKTLEQQKMVSHRGEERDFIGFYREGEAGMIAVLQVRAGKVSDSSWYPFKKLVEDNDVIENFITQYYQVGHYIPPEIYVSDTLSHELLLSEYLSECSDRKVAIKQPKRGEKKDLLTLAIKNAEEAFRQQTDKQANREAALEYLQERLQLTRFPRRMECFDISNIQGKQPVGSMVSFKEGEPDKSFYRRFKIKTLPDEPNDYAMMNEVLTRRFKRAVGAQFIAPSNGDQVAGVMHDAPTATNQDKWSLPDLLVIDGGKGQLNIAKQVLIDLDILNVDLCSLAKPKEGEDRDKVFIPGRANPILLPKNSQALHLLMALRDEAHRFAITFHRSLRQKKLQSSLLDEIAGIGPAKKKALLKHFGSLKRVKEASLEQLSAVSGITNALAEVIYQALHNP